MKHELAPLTLSIRGNALRFNVRVQPRSSRNAIEGTHAQALKVRLTAPPVEGAANDALVALLADELGLPKRAVRIVGGETGRTKIVEVEGVEPDALMRLALGAKR